MLSIYILSKYNIRLTNGMLYQSLNFTMRLSSDLSSSLSSDSSDSDSDNEKAKSKRKYDKSAAISDNKNLQNYLNDMTKKIVSGKIVQDTIDTHSKEVEQESAEVASDLTAYLNKMIMAKKTQKTIDVALQPKSKNKKSTTTHLSYEKKLINAAENVANTIGGDKTKTTSDLLEKVLASRIQALKEDQLKDVKLQKDTKWKQPLENKEQNSEKKSIIQTLLDEYSKQPSLKDKQPIRSQQSVEVEKSVEVKQSPIENSIARQLLNSINQSLENNIKKSDTSRDIKIWNGKPTEIFEQMVTPVSNIPELKTWTALEQRELKALTLYPPANAFQEMILWTEQGKLWKFPIDNEQGMEGEHNVHFADHVFMERHLKGWCPKSGPVRHFMELVCTGLSKNPYLTVQEKINHIMWYKDYFASKHDLLKELGAIEDPYPNKVKEITE